MVGVSEEIRKWLNPEIEKVTLRNIALRKAREKAFEATLAPYIRQVHREYSDSSDSFSRFKESTLVDFDWQLSQKGTFDPSSNLNKYAAAEKEVQRFFKKIAADEYKRYAREHRASRSESKKQTKEEWLKGLTAAQFCMRARLFHLPGEQSSSRQQYFSLSEVMRLAHDVLDAANPMRQFLWFYHSSDKAIQEKFQAFVKHRGDLDDTSKSIAARQYLSSVLTDSNTYCQNQLHARAFKKLEEAGVPISREERVVARSYSRVRAPLDLDSKSFLQAVEQALSNFRSNRLAWLSSGRRADVLGYKRLNTSGAFVAVRRKPSTWWNFWHTATLKGFHRNATQSHVDIANQWIERVQAVITLEGAAYVKAYQRLCDDLAEFEMANCELGRLLKQISSLCNDHKDRSSKNDKLRDTRTDSYEIMVSESKDAEPTTKTHSFSHRLTRYRDLAVEEAYEQGEVDKEVVASALRLRPGSPAVEAKVDEEVKCVRFKAPSIPEGIRPGIEKDMEERVSRRFLAERKNDDLQRQQIRKDRALSRDELKAEQQDSYHIKPTFVGLAASLSPAEELEEQQETIREVRRSQSLKEPDAKNLVLRRDRHLLMKGAVAPTPRVVGQRGSRSSAFFAHDAEFSSEPSSKSKGSALNVLEKLEWPWWRRLFNIRPKSGEDLRLTAAEKAETLHEHYNVKVAKTDNVGAWLQLVLEEFENYEKMVKADLSDKERSNQNLSATHFDIDAIKTTKLSKKAKNNWTLARQQIAQIKTLMGQINTMPAAEANQHLSAFCAQLNTLDQQTKGVRSRLKKCIKAMQVQSKVIQHRVDISAYWDKKLEELKQKQTKGVSNNDNIPMQSIKFLMQKSKNSTADIQKIIDLDCKLESKDLRKWVAGIKDELRLMNQFDMLTDEVSQTERDARANQALILEAKQQREAAMAAKKVQHKETYGEEWRPMPATRAGRIKEQARLAAILQASTASSTSSASVPEPEPVADQVDAGVVSGSGVGGAQGPLLSLRQSARTVFAPCLVDDAAKPGRASPAHPATGMSVEVM